MIWQPKSKAPLGSRTNCIWLRDDENMWLGWRSLDGWHDAADWAGKNKDIGTKYFPRIGYGKRTPKFWQPRLPEGEGYIPLPEELDTAGEQLIDASDEVGIDAQGGAWIRVGEGSPVQSLIGTDKTGWKYLLVTPRAHESATEYKLSYLFDPQVRAVSQAMTREDVIVVDPNNPMFQVLSRLASVNFGGTRIFMNDENRMGFIADDGRRIITWLRLNAVVKRMLKTPDGSDFRRPSPLPEEIRKALESSSAA